MSTFPQTGILDRPPDHALFVALDLKTADPATIHAAVEHLREVLKKELRSQLDETTPDSPKDQPSAETGELGFRSGFHRYRLTVTVGFAKSAYDKLGATEAPADLRPIDWAKLSDTPLNPVQSDLLIQICSDSIYINEHVVRRVLEELPGEITLVWALPGSQRHTSRAGRVSREDGRALIGFLDGTSNLDPRHKPDDERLVFVDPDDMADYPPRVPEFPPGDPSPYGGTPQQVPVFPDDLASPPTAEPECAAGGTYLVLRASVIDMSSWDPTPLGTQETTIGRRKVTGNPVATNPDEPTSPIAEPDFSSDPEGAITPLAAHIRKTNPRGPDDALRRIFRRGYPLLLPTTNGLELGLTFVCFGRTITTQFEFITRAWTANPDFPRPGAGVDQFRSFETVLGGGYYFVPGLAKKSQPWSWQIPDATVAASPP